MNQAEMNQARPPQTELRQLTDRDEITALVYRLGMYLDEGRFDELTSILTENAVAQTPGGVAEGRDALIAQARRNHSADQRIQHVISNVLVTLDGDRADVRANLIATFAGGGDGAPEDRLAPEPHFTLGEIYRFAAIRTPDGWRLSRVRTIPVWTTGSRP
jgi:hypothetical protein